MSDTGCMPLSYRSHDHASLTPGACRLMPLTSGRETEREGERERERTVLGNNVRGHASYFSHTRSMLIPLSFREYASLSSQLCCLAVPVTSQWIRAGLVSQKNHTFHCFNVFWLATPGPGPRAIPRIAPMFGTKCQEQHHHRPEALLQPGLLDLGAAIPYQEIC